MRGEAAKGRHSWVAGKRRLVGRPATLDGHRDREASRLGVFGLLEVDFEYAVGVVRAGLSVARPLGQRDRARELSERTFVAEAASVLDLGALHANR